MPNASELARREEEAKINNELPDEFLKWKKEAYPLSKKAMDEAYRRKRERIMTDKLTDTVERVAKDRADWLLDAVACATQDRRFLRGDSEYDVVSGDAILLNGAKSIRVAIAALKENK